MASMRGPALAALLLLSAALGAGCLGPGAAGGGEPTGDAATSPPQASGASCAASPAMDVGPYFVRGAPQRSDVRAEHPDPAAAAGPDGATEADGDPFGEDPDEEFIDGMGMRSELRLDAEGTPQEGVALRLTLTVNELVDGTCRPMVGARVDIWHANAFGRYSGFQAEGTAGEDWLRGAQVTDAQGQVAFTTIWPGWYPGRATHIHVKVREGTLDFTSQFFFDEAMNDHVEAAYAPYNARATRDTRNGEDGIYARRDGDLMILLTQEADGAFTGTKTVVVT